MRNLFRRESKVEKYSQEHVELIYQCFLGLEELMPHYYVGDYKNVNLMAKKIAIKEHEADELRRKMELEFYEGAFLPFDREDRIVLTESVDSVADVVESAAFTICLSRVQFPSEFEEDFKKMMKVLSRTMTTLKDCINYLEEDLGKAITKAHEIEELEDQADIIERRVIKNLYRSYKADKFGVLKLLELKETIRKLANVADRAEDASDRALIIAAKRRG